MSDNIKKMERKRERECSDNFNAAYHLNREEAISTNVPESMKKTVCNKHRPYSKT